MSKLKDLGLEVGDKVTILGCNGEVVEIRDPCVDYPICIEFGTSKGHIYTEWVTLDGRINTVYKSSVVQLVEKAKKKRLVKFYQMVGKSTGVITDYMYSECGYKYMGNGKYIKLNRSLQSHEKTNNYIEVEIEEVINKGDSNV